MLLELYAATRVAEERAQARYTAHLQSPHVDPDTAALLRTINGDEVWHLAWVQRRLRELAAIEGEERVAAALRRFHAADAAVAADLGDLERQTLGFSFSDAPLSAGGDGVAAGRTGALGWRSGRSAQPSWLPSAIDRAACERDPLSLRGLCARSRVNHQSTPKGSHPSAQGNALGTGHHCGSAALKGPNRNG